MDALLRSADPHIRNSKAITAISSAAGAGHLEAVLRLVGAGAAWRGRPDIDVVKLLCKKTSYKCAPFFTQPSVKRTICIMFKTHPLFKLSVHMSVEEAITFCSLRIPRVPPPQPRSRSRATGGSWAPSPYVMQSVLAEWWLAAPHLKAIADADMMKMWPALQAQLCGGSPKTGREGKGPLTCTHRDSSGGGSGIWWSHRRRGAFAGSLAGGGSRTG